jgi:maltose alpha-D-glucosyltransferase/alpha-amylase
MPLEALADVARPLLELAGAPPSRHAREHVGIALDAAAVLGRRTAELHMRLAAGEDPAFAPEPLTGADVRALAATLRQRAQTAVDRLKDNLPRLPDDAVADAGLVLRRRSALLGSLRELEAGDAWGQRTRVHGDYHLGQVLRVRGDYVILDFEGEPARPLPERRSKQSALKDVAGMLRSYSYAAYAALLNHVARRPEDVARVEPWARLWERSTGAEFLRAYRGAADAAAFLPPAPESFGALLHGYLLDKALYELQYELDSRPNWIRIPLWGLRWL